MRSCAGVPIDMTTLPPLFLASSSPRRRQLLKLLGLPFTVGVAPTDEAVAQGRFRGSVEEMAQWLDNHKAAAALTLPAAEGHLVITADTTVTLDCALIGQPLDELHSRRLLLAPSSPCHYILAGSRVN